MQKNSWIDDGFCSMQFSLIIQGEIIDFDDLCEVLGFDKPSIIHKGDVISKVVGKSEKDIYIYELKYDNNDLINERFKEFLDELLQKKKRL